MTCRFKIDMRNLMNFKGLIKSTDHRPLTHRPTGPPTQRTRFYFKDLINEEYSFYRTQTQLGRRKVIPRFI